MKKLLAVDGNSILNRAFYGIRPLTTKEGLHTNAVYGFINILRRNLEAVQPDAFAVAFDLKAPTFRHQKYDAYKAGRKGMPEELAMQLPWAKKCAEAMGARVLTLEGYEADDILGTLSDMPEFEAFVLTGDRDSLQLIDDNTTVLLAGNSDTTPFNTAKFTETYGITPDRFVDLKALMGDSSDNIPGVAGIGEVTAQKLIAEFGSLDGVYENLDSPLIKKGQRTKLEAGRESAYLSQWLARIVRDAPIAISAAELDGYTERAETGRRELLDLFEKLEFSALIKRFGLDDATAVSAAEAPDKAQAETMQTIECATLADAAERALAHGDRLAIMPSGGKTSFAADDKHVYLADGEELRELLLSLHERGVKLVVYDSKPLYTKFDLASEAFLFDLDVTLAAYVVDPTDNNFEPDRLKLRWLGDSSEGFDASTLLRVADELMRIITEREQTSLLFDIEMPLAAVLARMESAGFKVDTKGVEEFSIMLGNAASEIAERIYFAAGCEFNLRSPIQLSEVLFEKLGLPHGKKNKNGSYSTNAEILEKLAPYHPIVSDILDYRQLTKLQSTYGEGLVKAADADGRIHSSFNQTITATGRLSSTEPNLQNIPVRTELGRELRRFFIPDEKGRVLIDADYSQIELRLLAHISGDEAMIEAFNSGVDIHTVTASQAFGVPIEAVTSELRKRAKAVNFGIVYGISDFSLAQDIGVTKAKAAEYISSYLARYSGVAAYLRDIVAKASEDGYVTTMFGRRRYIPELSAGKKMLRAFGERVAMNSPIQGAAADLIKIAMVRVHERLKREGLNARLILQVHDELLIEAHRDCAEKAEAILREEMENAASLAVPLTVEIHTGDTWYDAK